MDNISEKFVRLEKSTTPKSAIVSCLRSKSSARNPPKPAWATAPRLAAGGLTHDPSFPKGQLEKPIRHVPKSEPYFILRQLEPDALRWCGKTGGGLLICAWLGYFFD